MLIEIKTPTGLCLYKLELRQTKAHAALAHTDYKAHKD